MNDIWFFSGKIFIQLPCQCIARGSKEESWNGQRCFAKSCSLPLSCCCNAVYAMLRCMQYITTHYLKTSERLSIALEGAPTPCVSISPISSRTPRYEAILKHASQLYADASKAQTIDHNLKCSAPIFAVNVANIFHGYSWIEGTSMFSQTDSWWWATYLGLSINETSISKMKVMVFSIVWPTYPAFFPSHPSPPLPHLQYIYPTLNPLTKEPLLVSA